ncbi:chromosomal replication initiator protein [Crocosphaera subtropica ATCC 51142]|uniref:Chromosomal replication initiator protein DnaA n=1 Tax=Crocosphaera subtropica (strain ATCC 51142 / BH68) TaxID=43989 RepID=DNAA_CROS5|nr:chromosomal replication initiator protein DnaA [Crocosphaera subtropica]B1X0X6.1 RecName: Full=Chromosomal replication initiator protein DnaA [Crocosphaera subtropica ATCC 51142]ACB53015.1 chromosomal replication initiator protein [Crocosphaera subtropica ATCC 51142]
MTISPQYIWNQVLDRLKLRLNPTAYETWIASATVQTFQDNCLVIQVENPFILNHLQKTYYSLILEEVETIVGYPIAVKLTTSQEQNLRIVDKNKDNLSSTKLQNKRQQESPKLNQLNPRYNFSRFVVGPTNRMAHAASLAVAESPGREFNPLFLCGGVGLGKTHLMQAIAYYRLELYPNANVFYVSTEQFTNDLITSIRQDSMENFREHYRTADILLVDDIQFIEGKEYTQEEFFHTFNTLHEAGKQVVIASDRPPKRIPSLQDRLVSRFSMGLIADIQVPDLETRMAILQKKAEYENIRLPRDVIEYIATNYTSNIRELEGALIRAVTYISISGLSMTVENIAPVLNPPMEQITASPEIIIQIVAENFNVSVEDLKGSSRRREISLARQIGMYLMRQHTDLSLPRIGEEFGGKDHTTVLYSCDKISKLQKKDWDLSQQLSELSDRINIASRNQN